MSEPELDLHWPEELSLDDEPGPAAFITRAQTDGMIFGALEQAGFSSGRDRISGVGRRVDVPKPGLGTRSLAAAALLALLSVGSASAAVMWFGKRHELAPSAPRVAPVERPRRVSKALPLPVVVEEETPDVAAEPAQLADKPVHRSRAPEDLLVEGNRLRAERRWARADEAYTRAAHDAPRSQTAYVARVASAAVRLEHLHDARGALAHYRAALAQSPDGPLREEIQWGIADCYRALKDRTSERAALRMFVREHPDSPLLTQARARLD